MSVITIDMLCGCQWEPKNKRTQHFNNKKIGLLSVELTRRESSCLKTLVSRMKRNQLRNKGETDIIVCLTETD